MKDLARLAVPDEPVLPLADIQGIAVPGFFKPHQTLIGLSLPSRQAILNFRKLLRDLCSAISTGAETLADRRHHRTQQLSSETRAADAVDTKVLMAIAFTSSGLDKLTPGTYALPHTAFRLGLHARSALLGDPTSPREEGHPTNWKIGGPASPLDCLFVVAGGNRGAIDPRVEDLQRRLEATGVETVYIEKGDVRDDLKGHEHFGFSDGVSQPGIRGRASEAHNDFVTPRHISPAQFPESHLYGYPGQDLVWPGEFVLGLPSTSPDPLVPGVPSPAIPSWTVNGSFLVFRRLRQDVGLFWRTMRDTVARLKDVPGFGAMTEERLASLIVGRWPSGSPVNRVPTADNPDLGNEPLANNHFRFDSNAAPLPLQSGYHDPFVMSAADPAGSTCPWAAHIRKVNTRDSASDMGGRDSTYMRRILRVGVPFGKPLDDIYATKDQDPLHGDRGLLFLSVQSSIEDQFEFLAARWMGDPTRPKTPGGHDILVGQNGAPGEARVRRCVLFGEAARQAALAIDAQWIVPTGGGYLFLPSLTALRYVLAADD